MTMSSPRHILVVEDEYFLADDLGTMLTDRGAIVVGPVATEDGALALLAERRVDCAILDINLHGRMIYPLARALQERQVPILFVSGYDHPPSGAGFGDVELIRKPCTADAVMAGIARALARAREAGA